MGTRSGSQAARCRGPGADACPIPGTPGRPLPPSLLPHLEAEMLWLCPWPPGEKRARQAHSWLCLPPEAGPHLRTRQPRGGPLAPWHGPRAMATPAWHAAVFVPAEAQGEAFPDVIPASQLRSPSHSLGAVLCPRVLGRGEPAPAPAAEQPWEPRARRAGACRYALIYIYCLMSRCSLHVKYTHRFFMQD